MDDESLMKPSICEKIFNDCADNCDSNNNENLSECYALCEQTVDKCIEKEESLEK